MSAASSIIGLRSEPPPNHDANGVQNILVFMCTAGVSGERICATRLMPDAQNRGSSSSPGIALRALQAALRLGPERAVDGRDVHPDLLEHPPLAHHRHHPAAGVGLALAGAAGLLAHEAAGGQIGERTPVLLVLQPLEGGADVVAQPREPGGRAGLGASVMSINPSRPPSAGTGIPARRRRCADRNRGDNRGNLG